ncbi:type II secretion system protein GspD [Candidatus Protochlamydia phocaeensis]|uniref:type II secretion system protein GspD n=1 Tax=Candidatus Protochlamydia phocaeensis TaxID=1414722 RepID=UPI000838A3A4|nr:type II secretion system protein GspD [Candidatus Protochlamydia phocaeensis]
MTKQWIWIAGLLFLLGSSPSCSWAQSISEKKANLKSVDSDLDRETEKFLFQVNQETQDIHAQIQRLYETVFDLYRSDAPPEEYRHLLNEINERKRYLAHLEMQWRELASRSSRTEGYGLWHAPETTLEQLIIDYGSQDYVYLIPPDVGSIKLSVDSNLPIPRAAWSEMLELILSQNGVGIKALNPYLRQLFLIKQNHSNLRLITNQRQDLEVLPPEARVSFVLSPEPSEVRRTYAFLERFINPNSMVLQVVGRDILLIGQAGEIIDLLKLYDFVATNRGEKDYRLIPVFKVKAGEMARILEATFDQAEHGVIEVETAKGVQLAKAGPDINGIKIVVLENMAQALFVVGTREEVRKAEEIVRKVECEIGGARDKVVFWYNVKHSDAEELADVLFRVYNLMIATGTGMDMPNPQNVQNEVVVVDNPRGPPPPVPPPPQKEPPILLYGQEGYYQEGGYIVNPAPAQPHVFVQENPNEGRENFIVDLKTGSIVMVVETDILPKIKELLRKLDVPKKMVQIETLLFEKILTRDNTFGLNLLKIGDHIANNKNITGAVFNNLFPKGKDHVASNAGVFEFFLSRKGSDCGIPPFDLAYRFLLSQDDVQINSSPSILTVNQTPATIAINEDISINTGVFEVETAKGVTLKDAFTRAQYGITISIKPTIHLSQREEEDQDFDYVTLETDITFDTIHPGGDKSRPDVTRRHITNQVQVPDGDTVILGGLRRKITNDNREAIPFLGELPGLGKLFSINSLRDSSTEMFIFITPHIVKDPKEQLQCLRQELLCLRPGDIPYFLECVEEAHRYEKTRLMEGSMTMLFGRPQERYYILDSCACEGEYDGR